MEHLPQGVTDTEGCFVYQVIIPDGCSCPVLSSPAIGEEDKTNRLFHSGQLVSIDLVRASRSTGSKNGPFLRLSDGIGWLFEKMQGEVMMKQIPVSVGLWTLYVDNSHNGIALRRHPVDRLDLCLNVQYKPMQKIHCDRKVKHPSTGINFYRVQGTEGWVFDRRLVKGNVDRYMLLDENMVEDGLFVYENVDSLGINVRHLPDVGDNSRTDLVVHPGELISVDIIRKSPFRNGNGPFLRLSDGSGWLFENRENTQLMKRLLVREGEWVLRVVNSPSGIALRRLPIDSKFMCHKNPAYKPGEILHCTHMVQASSGVKFYCVENTEGWVFDRRDGQAMLQLLSEQSTPRNGSKRSSSSRNEWSPDFIRGVAASIEGLTEVSHNEQSRAISFCNTRSDDIRINVYYKTRTIGTALTHPSKGAPQLFRRNCTTDELIDIFQNPRIHTGKGYRRKYHAQEIVETPHGKGILADQEIEIRASLLELDEEIAMLLGKRDRLLKQIRDTDLRRAKEARKMKAKIEARLRESAERQEQQNQAAAFHRY